MGHAFLWSTWSAVDLTEVDRLLPSGRKFTNHRITDTGTIVTESHYAKRFKRSSEGFPVLEKRCLNSLQFMENRVKIGQPQKAPLRHQAEHPPQPPQLATPNRRMSKISGLVFSSKMETCREPSEVITAEQPVGSRIKGRKRATWPKYGKQTLNLERFACGV